MAKRVVVTSRAALQHFSAGTKLTFYQVRVSAEFESLELENTYSYAHKCFQP